MPTVLSILSASLLISTAPVTAQDTSLWRYTTTEKIEFYRVSPLGDLVVGTKQEIVALDPETGEVDWTRRNSRELRSEGFNPIPFTQYSVLRTNDGIAMLDLATGEMMWDSTTVSLEKVRAYLPVTRQGIMVVYGETPESRRTFEAIEMATGEVRWRQDTLLQENPKLLKARGIHSFAGHQPLLLDTDTSFILNISEDGPTRIHLGTGELLWRLDLDKDAPMLSQGYAPMLLRNGVLFVPYERKLMAVNAGDGSVIWQRQDNFRSRVIQMELTSHGLVVRGRKPPDEDKADEPGKDFFLDLLDPETGASMWQRSFRDLKVNTPFVVEGAAIFVAKEEELVALDYQDGLATRIAEFKFEGGGRPEALEVVSTNFVISANQNFLSFTSAGDLQYHQYYEEPGRSLLEQAAILATKVGGVVARLDCFGSGGGALFGDNSDSDCLQIGDLAPFLGPRFQNAEQWANFAYVYTKQPDYSSGREGFSLVRLDKRDGQEIGRVWMDSRRPDYLRDPLSDLVFVKANDKEIIAFKFSS
jgi:outer membrane protein assembly factor BamB